LASLDALAPYMDRAHAEALRVLREHGDPEDVAALDMIRGNAVSPSIHAPEVVAIYHACMIGALARAIEKANVPRPRGRPRKAVKVA
jgi:hypothetical protein